MLCKGLVGGILAEFQHAVEFGVFPAAAEVAPGAVGDPGFEYEVAAEVDAADFVGAGEGAFTITGCWVEDVGAFAGVNVSLDAWEPG